MSAPGFERRDNNTYFNYAIKVNTELGHSWLVRKTANLMDVRTEVVAKDEGIFFSTKTKLKNFDSLLPYTGTSIQKGMHDEVCYLLAHTPGKRGVFVLYYHC